MVGEFTIPSERESEFNRFVISEYLRLGSVDKVFEENNYEIPISYPGVQRLLDKWGIVKAAGPNSKLSEALCFLSLLSDHKIPLERLYRDLPPSFKTSMGTMHRILHNIKEGVVRRYGTALVITSNENPYEVLVGDDVSTPRLELGKPFGSVSLPMGYSKHDEEYETSVLRVLQQEVFTNEAVNRRLPNNVIPNEPRPFMYLDIADVRVGVFHLSLPKGLDNPRCFSSSKIVNHRFLSLVELASGVSNFRLGIKEIALGYKQYLLDLDKEKLVKPRFLRSIINFQLSQQPALEYE